MDADDDEDFLERFQRGDTEALGVLVERYRRPLFGFIQRMVPSQADADEVFQDVWMRVIHKAGAYRRDRFRGWVFRIAHNLMIDRARRHRPVMSLDAPSPECGNATRLESLRDERPSPRETAGSLELERELRETVAGLPPEQREVFLLRVDQDMPFREIARIQGVSINTALARMQYALGKLRRRFQEVSQEKGPRS